MGKKCFISNLLIKNAERRENGVKARVKKTDAARISNLLNLEVLTHLKILDICPKWVPLTA